MNEYQILLDILKRDGQLVEQTEGFAMITVKELAYKLTEDLVLSRGKTSTKIVSRKQFFQLIDSNIINKSKSRRKRVVKSN